MRNVDDLQRCAVRSVVGIITVRRIAGRGSMSARPVVAIISNSLTPYRLHLHRRIVREMPEISLASLFTHAESNAPWAAQPPPEINPVQFGPGEPSGGQSSLRNALHEWRKGGRIVQWLREHHAQAVVVLGYNDL